MTFLWCKLCYNDVLMVYEWDLSGKIRPLCSSVALSSKTSWLSVAECLKWVPLNTSRAHIFYARSRLATLMLVFKKESIKYFPPWTKSEKVVCDFFSLQYTNTFIANFKVMSHTIFCKLTQVLQKILLKSDFPSSSSSHILRSGQVWPL